MNTCSWKAQQDGGIREDATEKVQQRGFNRKDATVGKREARTQSATHGKRALGTSGAGRGKAHTTGRKIDRNMAIN